MRLKISTEDFAEIEAVMRNSPSCVWLGNLRDWMTERAKNGEKYSIVTCSALKRQYRDILRGAEGKVALIHLTPP